MPSCPLLYSVMVTIPIAESTTRKTYSFPLAVAGRGPSRSNDTFRRGLLGRCQRPNARFTGCFRGSDKYSIVLYNMR